MICTTRKHKKAAAVVVDAAYSFMHAKLQGVQVFQA